MAGPCFHPKAIFMRILSLFFFLLFSLFAYFQYNDPDSLAWIAMYATVAVLFGLMATGRYFRWVSLGVAGLLSVGLVIYAPGVWAFLTNNDGITFSQGMSNQYLYIEEAREFGGLLIALTAVVFLIFQGRKINR